MHPIERLIKDPTLVLQASTVRIPGDEVEAVLKRAVEPGSAPQVTAPRSFDRSELTGTYLVARDNFGLITMDRVLNRQVVERRQFQDPGLAARPPLLERLKQQAKALADALVDQVTILRNWALK